MSDEARFDATIHAPHRLRICALLADVKELEFAVLRDTVGVSDSVLSKQLAVLAAARYVRSRRATRDTRQRVWVALTPEGRWVYAAHVAALREIVGDAAERAGPVPSAVKLFPPRPLAEGG